MSAELYIAVWAAIMMIAAFVYLAVRVHRQARHLSGYISRIALERDEAHMRAGQAERAEQAARREAERLARSLAEARRSLTVAFNEQLIATECSIYVIAPGTRLEAMAGSTLKASIDARAVVTAEPATTAAIELRRHTVSVRRAADPIETVTAYLARSIAEALASEAIWQQVEPPAPDAGQN